MVEVEVEVEVEVKVKVEKMDIGWVCCGDWIGLAFENTG